MEAVGIHTFAGGFSHGVQHVFNVKTHLETHGFGIETAKALCDVNVINCPAAEWPDITGDFAFGNPRCTGFSTITSGYDARVHGPFAAATIDILEFVNYSTGRYPIFAWESVQQAYTVGRPLLDQLVEQVAAKDYRVAHVFVNSASFGNAQHRKRYFFIAYHKSKNFNIDAPNLSDYQTTLFDAIYHLRDVESPTTRLTPDEAEAIKNLPNGWNLNMLAAYGSHLLPQKMQDKWLLRESDMPFSLHCVTRLQWFCKCPTIHSSAGRFIHPEYDRPLTYLELATLAGWPMVPVGQNPIAEIAKGVCPEVGKWVAEQAYHYLNDAWGSEDYESKFNHNTGVFDGRNCEGAIEKVFNITHYIPQTVRTDYPYENFRQHRFNVDERTGRPIRPWEDIAKQSRKDNVREWIRRASFQHTENFFDEQCEAS